MTDPDLTRIGETLAKASDARSLRAVLASFKGIDWERFPQARLQLSRMLIRKGLARDGLDLLPEPEDPLQAEVEQLRAYGLANTGAPLTAARHLQELLAQGHEDSETLGLLGRTEKDLARRAEQRTEAMSHWRNALQYYRRAFDLTGDSYPGINAAALSLRVGAIAQAQSLAQKVLSVCDAQLRGASNGDDWTLSTKAEALLILGQTAAAQQFYRQAAERLGSDWSALGST
ncbi:MAG: TRAFs-binding domain-containing protein, partial [Pseudomonadales bacterium]